MLFVYVIFYIIFINFKDGSTLWKNLFCLSLLPFIYMVMMAIGSFFGGTGFFGTTTSGIDAAWTVIVLLFVLAWYIYIPALIILLISIKKVFRN